MQYCLMLFYFKQCWNINTSFFVCCCCCCYFAAYNKVIIYYYCSFQLDVLFIYLYHVRLEGRKNNVVKKVKEATKKKDEYM